MDLPEYEPFRHHVYIGYCPDDEETVLSLLRQLKNEGVIFSRRETIGTQSSIKDGIRTSKKCLLFLSPDYLKDQWCEYETGAVLKKVELFGPDTLTVMKSKSMEEVPEKLKGFREAVLESDDISGAQLATVIKTEPKVSLKYGPAAGYFHGFLNIILPDFKDRMTTQTVQPNWLSKTLKKMLIIVPESCTCPTTMEEKGKIEFTKKYVILAGNRAGNITRDYKNSLYKVTEGNEEYYFAGEFTTPMVTIYETFKAGYYNMTCDDLHDERDVFYYTLKAILSHPDNIRCKDQFKLVYWSDVKDGKEKSLDLHQFLLSVIKNELYMESRNEASKIPLSGVHCPVSEGLQSTFERTEGVAGCNPTRLYEGIDKYPLNNRPRGKCLVINIIKFQESDLQERIGSDKDTEILKKLFGDLHFDVESHIDVDSENLERLLITMSTIDHSVYDAFVCCLLSHGVLGGIYTSDGKVKQILDIVEFFADRMCAALKGKPKMFFIQACQAGYKFIPPNDSGIQVVDDFAAKCAIEEQDKIQGDAKPCNDRKANKTLLVPSSPDFLMSYSTLPVALSYRHILCGSFYIRALDKCLRNGDEIDRALKQVTTMVRQELAALERTDLEQQLPFHLTSAMERLIYL